MTGQTPLPTYIETLGATGVTIWLLVTVLEIARTAGIVPLGWAGRSYSKRTVMIVAVLISVLANLTKH